MRATKRLAAGLASFVLFTGGMLGLASPAQAMGGCPPDKLCLYGWSDFYDLYWTMASTNACLGGIDYPHGPNSYVNNLPVKVRMYHFEGPDWKLDGTISPGGASSNAQFPKWQKACTGTATP
ncbi:peptidase inhibitor [Streptomyces sp. NPDC057011]|uniref:peptidase inhibitor n=1 Tax=unclassified Streptomyces TaxID=2593676 RepID=UPI00363B83C9